MKTKKREYNSMKAIFISLILLSVLVACKNDDSIASATETAVVFDDTDFEATDWTTETHSNDADPNFEEVFNDLAGVTS